MTPKKVLENHVAENLTYINFMNSEMRRLWEEEDKILDKIEELKSQKKKLEAENKKFKKIIKEMEDE
jgi:hypothetical protein